MEAAIDTPQTVFLDALVADLVSELNDDDREAYEERAGIIEFDAQLPKSHAECLALLNVLHRNPLALTRVRCLWIEVNGEVKWLFVTDLQLARKRLASIGGRELEPLDLTDVVEKHHRGFVMLTVVN
jgi:hypothetical protein